MAAVRSTHLFERRDYIVLNLEAVGLGCTGYFQGNVISYRFEIPAEAKYIQVVTIVEGMGTFQISLLLVIEGYGHDITPFELS